MSKKVPKAKRTIIRVQWDRAHYRWKITAAGKHPVADHDPNKDRAVEVGRQHGCWLWSNGHPAQLLIYNKNGQIGKGRNAEASYGCNSKSPG